MKEPSILKSIMIYPYTSLKINWVVHLLKPYEEIFFLSYSLNWILLIYKP